MARRVTEPIMPKIKHMLLAASLLAGAGGAAAYAQLGGAATYDPQQLPAIQGKVAQYSLTPRGDVDGFILEDGTQVHMPPHLSTQLVFAVRPGDAVTVRGLRARAIPVVQAMQVTNDATKASVQDSGPQAGGPGPKEGRHGPGRPSRPEANGQPMEAQGRVKAQLYGPRGDMNGVLLDDGTQVRLPPPEAQRLSAQLAVGQAVAVRGDGISSPLGRVVAARELGASAGQLQPLQVPRGPGGERRAPPPPGGPAVLPPTL